MTADVALTLTSRLKDLSLRVENATDFVAGEGELTELLGDVAAGFVSNRSLKVLQRALVHFGEEGALRSYLVGSQVVLPGLVVKEEKVSLCSCLLCFGIHGFLTRTIFS